MAARNQILTFAEMQATEQLLVDRGTSVDELMQHAGRGAAEFVWRMAAGRAVTVLCGPGNNGGDGYVIAEVLRERGNPVQVVAPLTPATQAARSARGAFGGEVADGSERGGSVFVDCLFGSGLNRALGPQLRALLHDLHARHELAIAIDLPSGVEADSGKLLGDVKTYDLTLALGAWKRAHYLGEAAQRMGALRLIDIGVGEFGETAQLIDRPQLAPPAPGAHKYSRGLLGVVAGAMPGAALLACEAAMRAGAGYVKLFSDHSHPDAPAALVVDGAPLDEALDDRRIDALLVGPGLGRTEEARERLLAVLEKRCPAVLDADALHLLDSDALEGVDAGRLLVTPHEGELKTLCKAFGVGATDKLAMARALSAATGLTVLAKGADTILVSRGTIGLFPPAPSWLSTAGTGDVLAGIAASRLATGETPRQAAAQAVWVHSEAARLCGPAFTADDLAAAVSRALAAFL